MKRVYLIRHAAPDFPDGIKRCIGTTELPIGPEGLAQAQAMAASLPPVSAVFSSPQIRALQTAQTIAPQVTTLEDLRELDFGLWENLTFAQIRARFPEAYAARGKDLSLPPPGAEENASGLARFTAAMEAAVRRSPGDLAVVTHSGISAVFLQALTGRWYKPQYCEIIPLIWNDCGFFQEETP